VWGPVLAQAGGSVLSEDGSEATVNEPEAVKSLQVFYDLAHTYKVTEPGAVDEQADFLDGKTSMWVSGIWTKNVMGGHEIENKYAAIPLPQIDPQNPRTIIAGYWWHVSNKVNTEVQKEAWKFLNYITEDPGDQFAGTGLLMPKPSIMESQAWKDYPFSDVFAIDLAAGEWPVSSPIYPQIEKAVNDAMERSLVGDMLPQESLDIAAEQINQALAEQ
jgi:ABC-type glycerol-3-phosphate transport system substrate-binding protein